jgi:hypothetical protein
MARRDETKFMVDDGNDSFVTIAEGQTVSSIFEAKSCSLMGIYFPSNLTSCNLTIQVAKFAHDTPAYIVTVDGATYAVPVSGGLFLPIPPYLTAACQRFRLISSAAQVQAVKIELALAPLFSAV